jgi:hypothetical protein
MQNLYGVGKTEPKGKPMRKSIITLLVLGLVFGSLMGSAEAKKKKKAPKPYTITATYDNPALGTAGVGLTINAPSFVSSATNVYLDVEIADAASPAPYADLSWDTDGDGVADTGITVCGNEVKDLSVPPGTTITAFMWAVPSPFCAGFSTSGTIKATFSATP